MMDQTNTFFQSLAAFFACLFILYFYLFKRWRRKFQKDMEAFVRETAPLGLTQTACFYRRYVYAYGNYKGFPTHVRPAYASRSDWMPALPIKGDKVWFIAMKIPGTAGLKAHLVFLHPRQSHEGTRRFFGWKKLEDNVFMVEKWSPDGPQIFQKLNPHLKARIFSLNQRYATRLSIFHDGDIKFLGKEKALLLAGGDLQWLNSLTLQWVVSQSHSLSEILEEMSQLGKELADAIG